MDVIGLLPCAGLGLRMRPLMFPKELLPISYEYDDKINCFIPRLSIEFSIQAFKCAEIRQCFVVVPDWKPEIMRYLGDGQSSGIHIAYLHNSRANGLADAVASLKAWASGKITCLALPDTQFYPQTSFVDLLDLLDEKNADLVLGVFPTSEPQCFAPVEFNSTGRVIRVEDKPIAPKFMNAWGIAVWKDSFWELFDLKKEQFEPGISISNIFNLAANAGLKVYAKYFVSGSFFDIGRIESLPFQLKGKPGE